MGNIVIKINEKPILFLIDKDSIIKVKVWDKERFKSDDLIGEC